MEYIQSIDIVKYIPICQQFLCYIFIYFTHDGGNFNLKQCHAFVTLLNAQTEYIDVDFQIVYVWKLSMAHSAQSNLEMSKKSKYSHTWQPINHPYTT